MSHTIQSCLSSQLLDQIGRNDVSPDELLAIEEHVSGCPRCRDMFDSYFTASQWSDHIQPALSETQMDVSSLTEDGADQTSAILKLLGPTDDPNMLGRIGNYEIVGVIGRGGMGAVFKGFDRSLNRFVAIKMLLPHLAASGAARKRFAREGQAVAAVVDDHVMAIHCVDQWQGIPYLVMTYSRGVSLQKRLNDHGPLEVREILRIGMQAAKGLAAAHAQGIVHRDIKPSNILLDQNVERVQLVDFGLARAVDDASLTCSGTLAGTPQYMSPEQARAEAVDHRSDLFSLGSVLYAMCAGFAPFRADSSYSVLRLIIEKEPRPIRAINCDIPDWLCAIIGKLMNKSPDDRYASADEVATIFKQCLAHVQDPVQHVLPLVTKAFKDSNQPRWNIVTKLQRFFSMMNDKRILSLIALILLLMAMLLPWPIATMASLETSIAFAVPAAMLSLGLALLSRSEYFSRIVLWIFGTTLGVAVVGIGISVPIWMQRYSEAQAIQQEAEATSRIQSTIDERNHPSKAGAETLNSKTKSDHRTQEQSAFRSQVWQEYTPSILESARKAGKVVIIDFIADWCLTGKTLQTNELNRKEVLEAIDNKDVVPIEVDLSKKGAAGWDLVRKYGKISIPLLVIEGPGTRVPWQRDVYTASDVIEALTVARKETINPENESRSEKREGAIDQDGGAGSVHWGKPAENGLQAGVRISPPLKSYPLGQKISVELLFRNILTKPMQVTVPNFPSYEMEAYGTDGAKFESFVPPLEMIGGARVETIGDNPNLVTGATSRSCTYIHAGRKTYSNSFQR